MSLPELCLRRPVATTTCALAALVLGGVSLTQLPLVALAAGLGAPWSVGINFLMLSIIHLSLFDSFIAKTRLGAIVTSLVVMTAAFCAIYLPFVLADSGGAFVVCPTRVDAPANGTITDDDHIEAGGVDLSTRGGAHLIYTEFRECRR